MAAVYGELTVRLIDAEADLKYIASFTLMLCGSILTCFVFGPLAGFLGFAVVRRPALQGWKTVVMVSGIMLFISTLIDVIGLNLLQPVGISIITIVFVTLAMVVALLSTMKNVAILGMLLIALSGLLVPIITGYQHPLYTVIYLNLGTLVALVFIGIALIVKSLNISRPIHSLLSTIGLAAYTLGLVFVAADITGRVNMLLPGLAQRAMKSVSSLDLFIYANITASTLLAICGLLAFVSALLMAGSALKNVISKTRA